MAVATEYATGRRKCAIARAWVTGTAGDITVNEQPLEKAFPRLTLRQIIQLPLEMAGVSGKFSIKATVHGGGPTGQAGALRHAIARAAAPRPFEKGRAAHARLKSQRAEEVRSKGRQKAVPVLETVSTEAGPQKKGRLPAFPFFMSAAMVRTALRVTVRRRWLLANG
jgi:ribosomal protein S9